MALQRLLRVVLSSLHWPSYISWHNIALFLSLSFLFVSESHDQPCGQNILVILPFHFCGMVDRTSLIWNINSLCRFIFVAWLTLPALYGMSVNEFKYFCTTMEVSVSLLCFLYMNHPTVVCCNPVFRHDCLHNNHRTILHVRAGLAQACPNNVYQLFTVLPCF